MPESIEFGRERVLEAYVAKMEGAGGEKRAARVTSYSRPAAASLKSRPQGRTPELPEL